MGEGVSGGPCGLATRFPAPHRCHYWHSEKSAPHTVGLLQLFLGRSGTLCTKGVTGPRWRHVQTPEFQLGSVSAECTEGMRLKFSSAEKHWLCGALHGVGPDPPHSARRTQRLVRVGKSRAEERLEVLECWGAVALGCWRIHHVPLA